MGMRLSLILCAAGTAFGAGLSDTDKLFDTAKRLTFRAPTEALAMLPRLERAADRATIERLAILRAASVDPALAAREMARIIDQSGEPPWLGDVLMADAAAVAAQMDEAHGRRLTLAAARRHSEAALQNWALVERLPYSQDVLAAAALGAPDEAVALLAGNSPYSQVLNEAFARSADPRVMRLVALAHDASVPVPVRGRMAFLDLQLKTAQDAAAYFHALAEARLMRSPDVEAEQLDRGLTRAATELCQTYQQAPARAPEVARLSQRDLYLLLAYARAGDEDTYFARLFDQLAARGNVAKAIEQAGFLRFREFLEYALWFRRYPQLLSVAGSNGQAARMLARLFEGLELENALTAADAIASTPEPIRRGLRSALEHEQARTAGQAGVRRSLEASFVRGADATLPLALGALSDSGGTVLERYFFYDDADGVESFTNFQAQYAHDAAWRWEDRGGWIRLVSKRSAPAIEIVANVPVNALAASNRVDETMRARRQQAVTDYLGEREPSVIVHRGHAYHVEKTLAYVTRGTRLVFLGSCRGLKEIHSVIESSPQADIISTRAVGTMRVNDPLLKMLNRAILNETGAGINWAAFWRVAARRFAADADFASYIPPYRNGAAAFLRMYDATLAQ